MIALPALGFALAPNFKKEEVRWEPVGTPDEFTEDNYLSRTITVVPNAGQTGKTTVYLRKRNTDIDKEPSDEYNQFIAISSRCMHLGCPVRLCPPRSASSAPATAASTTSSAACRAVRRCVRSTASTPAFVTASLRLVPDSP